MFLLRMYRCLLKLYPREFYADFGDEMLVVFEEASRHKDGSQTLFYLREFGGLLKNIMIQHGQSPRGFKLHKLFQKRFIPLWIFLISLMGGAWFSLSYWGYLTLPTSRITQLDQIDRVSLVQFDADHIPTALPLENLPHLITPNFPPSQVLAHIPETAVLETVLDQGLAQDLTEALTREQVFVGAPRSNYQPEPMMGASCNGACFVPGLQPQADGSIELIFPQFTADGQLTQETITERITPNERWYYGYIRPAGYVIQGRDSEGTPMVFVAMTSGAFGNDRYRYHELIFTLSDSGLTLTSGITYNYDVAGLEGINLTIVTLVLFLLLMLAWSVILLIRETFRVIAHQVRRRRALV